MLVRREASRPITLNLQKPTLLYLKPSLQTHPNGNTVILFICFSANHSAVNHDTAHTLYVNYLQIVITYSYMVTMNDLSLFYFWEEWKMDRFLQSCHLRIPHRLLGILTIGTSCNGCHLIILE